MTEDEILLINIFKIVTPIVIIIVLIIVYICNKIYSIDEYAKRELKNLEDGQYDNDFSDEEKEEYKEYLENLTDDNPVKKL